MLNHFGALMIDQDPAPSVKVRTLMNNIKTATEFARRLNAPTPGASESLKILAQLKGDEGIQEMFRIYSPPSSPDLLLNLKQ